MNRLRPALIASAVALLTLISVGANTPRYVKTRLLTTERVKSAWLTLPEMVVSVPAGGRIEVCLSLARNERGEPSLMGGPSASPTRLRSLEGLLDLAQDQSSHPPYGGKVSYDITHAGNYAIKVRREDWRETGQRVIIDWLGRQRVENFTRLRPVTGEPLISIEVALRLLPDNKEFSRLGSLRLADPLQ